MPRRLDINRHIDKIRAQPGRNFDAFALKDIQDFVNGLVPSVPSAVASPATVIGGGSSAVTPAPSPFFLFINGAVASKANLNDALPTSPTGRMLGRWQLDSTIDPPNISVSLPNLGGVSARTTVTESIGASSQGLLVTLSNVAAVAVTLDSTVPSTFISYVENIGAGTATLTPSSGSINGVASVALTTGQAATIFFDGTNWWAALPGGGSTTLYADNEAPTDSGDHQNFTLAHTPNPAGSLQLFLKGTGYFNQFLFQGGDYTLTTNAIALGVAIVGSFTLAAFYRY